MYELAVYRMVSITPGTISSIKKQMCATGTSRDSGKHTHTHTHSPLQKMDETRRFTQWGELLSEMRQEIAMHLDPFTRRALALTCHEAHAIWYYWHGDRALFQDTDMQKWNRELWIDTTIVPAMAECGVMPYYLRLYNRVEGCSHAHFIYGCVKGKQWSLLEHALALCTGKAELTAVTEAFLIAGSWNDWKMFRAKHPSLNWNLPPVQRHVSHMPGMNIRFLLQWFDKSCIALSNDEHVIFCEFYALRSKKEGYMLDVVRDLSICRIAFSEDPENSHFLEWALMCDPHHRPHDALKWQQAIHEWLDTALDQYCDMWTWRWVYFHLRDLVPYMKAEHRETMRRYLLDALENLEHYDHDHFDLSILVGLCLLLGPFPFKCDYWGLSLKMFGPRWIQWEEPAMFSLLELIECQQLALQPSEVVRRVHASFVAYLPGEHDIVYLQWMRNWFVKHTTWGYASLVPLIDNKLILS